MVNDLEKILKKIPRNHAARKHLKKAIELLKPKKPKSIPVNNNWQMVNGVMLTPQEAAAAVSYLDKLAIAERKKLEINSFPDILKE